MTSELKDKIAVQPASTAVGLDTAYEAVREKAEADLANAMAGPRIPLQQISEGDTKNPEGEFAIPAPMTGPHDRTQQRPGPNQVGNSSGK